MIFSADWTARCSQVLQIEEAEGNQTLMEVVSTLSTTAESIQDLLTYTVIPELSNKELYLLCFLEDGGYAVSQFQ